MTPYGLALLLLLSLPGCTTRQVGETVYRALEQKSCHDHAGAQPDCARETWGPLREE